MVNKSQTSTTTTSTSTSSTKQESYSSTTEAIEKISQSINDMQPISSVPEKKPETPVTYTATSLVGI